MKKLLLTKKNDHPHWVGDGFPVRTIFTYSHSPQVLSPFLLMDYAGPKEFPPTEKILGVDEHPHRGFETVTIVYSGEVVHRDSAGGGVKIGPGDVQWMTAASGLVHEEKHGEDFARKGGLFEMVQLWVNLPAKHKMSKPRYQGLSTKSIPNVEFANNAGTLRVIAGEFGGQKGPAKTFTPIQLWDVRLLANGAAEFKMPAGHNCLVFVLSGQVRLGSGETLNAAELGALDPSGEDFSLTALNDAKILILAGEPIDEPVVGHGPFVMNTKSQILDAFRDFESGRMGTIGAIEGSDS